VFVPRGAGVDRGDVRTATLPPTDHGTTPVEHAPGRRPLRRRRSAALPGVRLLTMGRR
jgi:hypothetical protein